MNETRVPNENAAKEVARLLIEGSPEPVGRDSVLRDWVFPGVRPGSGLDESVGMRVSARFGIHAKSAP